MKNDFTYYLKNMPIRINNLGLIKDIYADNHDFLSDIIVPEIEEAVNNYYSGSDYINVGTITEDDNTKRLSLKNIKSNNTPVFLFCRIICNAETKIVLQLCGECYYKIWINSKICTVFQGWLGYAITTLKKGENVFIFELSKNNINDHMGIRLSKYSYEIKDNYISLLNRNLFVWPANAIIIFNSAEIYDKKPYEYMLIAGDSFNVDINQNVVVRLIKRNPWEVVQESTCNFSKKYTVDTSKLNYDNDNDLNNLVFQFEYKTKDGQVCNLKSELFLYPIKEAAYKVKEEAEKMLLSELPNDYDRLAIQYHLCLYKTIDDNNTLSNWNNSIYLRAVLNQINRGKHNDDFLYNTGSSKKFFKSKLDDSVEFYYISMPKEYDKSRKYPLLVIISTGRYSEISSSWLRYKNEPVIAVDISSRGVTMGSYVGEAAITEALNDLLTCFSIDKNKIYMTGYSNGASATWAYSKIYPHKVAGIFPVSGFFSVNGIENLNNIKIINISSKYDHLYNRAYKIPLTKLQKTSDFKGILTIEMIHDDFMQISCKEHYLDEMLKIQKNDYPNKIYYYTEQNRNCRAYWMEIHSIAFKKRHARVKAEIISGDIHINTQNTTGFTVTIPPQIKRNNFSIVINKVYKFNFIKYYDTELHFIKKSGRFLLIDILPQKVLSRKGTGLLDVYLDPMRIIVTEKENELLWKTANVFAHPSTNGWDPVVYVDYPIYSTSEINSEILSCSLIIIDNKSGNQDLSEIKKHMNISTFNDGYEYMGHRYEGNYCCMQVIPNPYDTTKSILYISCNNEKLLKENIFTRKALITSYANGLHPFWNNEALVYRDKKYYGVYEWGMNLEEIK